MLEIIKSSDGFKEVGWVSRMIARLEAAEKVLSIPHRCRKCGILQKITGKFFMAWKKAAGKI